MTLLLIIGEPSNEKYPPMDRSSLLLVIFSCPITCSTSAKSTVEEISSSYCKVPSVNYSLDTKKLLFGNGHTPCLKHDSKHERYEAGPYYSISNVFNFLFDVPILLAHFYHTGCLVQIQPMNDGKQCGTRGKWKLMAALRYIEDSTFVFGLTAINNEK